MHGLEKVKEAKTVRTCSQRQLDKADRTLNKKMRLAEKRQRRVKSRTLKAKSSSDPKLSPSSNLFLDGAFLVGPLCYTDFFLADHLDQLEFLAPGATRTDEEFIAICHLNTHLT